MKITKKIEKLLYDNYNLAAIFREYCKSEENLYIEQCHQLSTLADIMYRKADELYYLLIFNDKT